MEKTADLAMIQKTNLTPSTKRVSHRGSLLKGVAVYRVLYQSILNAKLTVGRIWVGKGAQATGMTASLRILSSKADSNTCESFTRSGLKRELVHQESPRSDVFRKRATKPLLNQRQRQKRLTWAVEKNNSVVQSPLFRWKYILHFIWKQGLRVWRKSGEAQIPCCLKSSVKFPQSVMIWAAMSSAGVGPLCFLKSTVNAAIYQEILEHFMLASADKL